MAVMNGNTIRRAALEKLAALSAKPSSSSGADFGKLCKRCPPPTARVNGEANGSAHTAKIPMKTAELEVILALCKAAPLVKTLDSAEQLLRQLAPYLPESSAQAIASSPALRDIQPSPWQVLTYNLTSALLALGINHPELRSRVEEAIRRYVGEWAQVATSISAQHLDAGDASDDASHPELETILILNASLLGFLEAAAVNARFWPVQERQQLVLVLRRALAEKFMVSTEAALSVVRNSRSHNKAIREWKRISKHYNDIGLPLGSMVLHQKFMQLVVASAALVVCPTDQEFTVPVLDYLQKNPSYHTGEMDPAENSLLENIANIAVDEMEFLNGDLDFLQRVGSPHQRSIASDVRAYIFKALACCMVYNEEISDPESLLTWLEATLADPVQISDEHLASTVLKCMPLVVHASPNTAINLSRLLPRLIVQGNLDPASADVAADTLSSILKSLPQDAVITTLYSLGNVLSTTDLPDRASTASIQNGHVKGARQNDVNGSAISLTASDTEEPSLVYGIVIQTIIRIAKNSKDEKIIALALSMLIQKIGRVTLAVDAKIFTESAILGAHSGVNELKSLLKAYARATHDAVVNYNRVVLDAIKSARTLLASQITNNSPLFEVLIRSFLDTIISQGDAHEKGGKQRSDTEIGAQEIAQVLEPLAKLVSVNFDGEKHELNEELVSLQRDAWFNIAVHGFHPQNTLGKTYIKDLRTLAQFSKPLIAEERAAQIESDVELNTILRRGKSAEHTDEQKKSLIKLLPKQESEIRAMSYSEVVFLNAVYLVEDLRASCGNCTNVLTYFLDPKVRSGNVGNCLDAISRNVVNTYLSRTLQGSLHAFSTPYLAQQLAVFFAGGCHRIEKVQQVAIARANDIIANVPSTLCQKSALFALLEILSMMWSACLESDTDEYVWNSSFVSSYGDVKIELSDNYDFRNATLKNFHRHAKGWVLRVIDIAPLDIKGLLQTYLSEHGDDSLYGHVSLGRSFALEMGSAVPTTDQRLAALDNNDKELGINQASDFIAQYTTRQEYRFVDGLVDQNDEEWLKEDTKGFNRLHQRPSVDRSIDDATRLLVDLEARTMKSRHVPIAELRDILRRAAALLCRVQSSQCSIIQHLVGIPFAVFTKQSIKLGISLWMSVIKENPRMESRILAAIAENWENTVKKKRGLFDDAFSQPDPFFVKQEFAPTDKQALLRRQHQAGNLIAPHFRLIQFLSSHFAATRLSSPYIEKIYTRLIRISLDAVSHGQTMSHPLARETHLHIVLLALRILTQTTTLHDKLRWRLKERILGSALAWFATPLKWSYGGNRVQMKAETQILDDIQNELKKSSADVGFKISHPAKSLEDKQHLLVQLLSAEHTRLMVWLYPLDHHTKHRFLGHHKSPLEGDASRMVDVAWAENPSLAVHLVARFNTPAVQQQVRFKIRTFPQRVLNEPDALEILLGTQIPSDVADQLKYFLYWKPVNPMTAVTYFLPAYGNHPFILQYAMRALESHSVDVTFFYVPQIVQALRYDALEYVERYIVEAGKISQLFAHQIIWNMKANSYKDEDSSIEDGIKPTLDKVMERLVASFSREDRSFYEREFAFFAEVTGISGKLKPYIKRPKQDKKEKIEEELRKIQVDVGVYLPSNPDGVVIGIDRKSGKPLQSHAKAPYMATFRIRKEKKKEITDGSEDNQQAQSVELWQSAIFKVGDDCRQDVLALQMISTFRGIFNSIGLDVWVYPYRVTATAPGCGVIDVLPNSISRDMIGREAVNALYEYFVSKYGGEESQRFQEARNNFVKSMAAYSIISYLLQFKDRHNGNLMIDDGGHIIHIDFGFCFDVCPGGIKFEQAPFKLTGEMLAVMGGDSPPSQSFKWFEELCIKSFLAARPHAEHLIHLVICMLDSGLPCFKPETIKNLRDRFVLEKTETEAAGYVRDLIKKSNRSETTKIYDHFQLMTNGIPY